MKKSSSSRFLFFAVIMLMAFSVNLLAQNSSLQKGNDRSPYSATNDSYIKPVFNTDGSRELLWDNFLTVSTTGIVSGEWGGLPVGTNQVICSEDFMVPSAETWTIEQINAQGFYSAGSAEATSWGVAFYSDNAGTPGTLIQAVTVPVVTGNANPSGTLSSAVILTGGGSGTKYWVSIYGIHPSASTLAAFRWNWYASSDPELLTEPFLRDDAGFFGGTAGWVSFTTLGLPDFNALMFQLSGTRGGGCPVTAASNPSPSDGAGNVSINPGNATWTNGTGTTAVEVFFGPEGNMVSVYNGAPTTSYSIPSPLSYNTTYEWKVVCRNDTCTGPAVTWSFTTEQNPLLATLFYDDFENGTSQWTITNDGGTCVWEIRFPPYPNTYTLPVGSSGGVFAADVDECGSGSTMLSTATFANPVSTVGVIDLRLEIYSDWNAIDTEDSCFVEASVNGTTWDRLLTYGSVDVPNTVIDIDMSAYEGVATLWIRLVSVQPGWDWWWVVDNVKLEGATPVELTSFTAATVNNNVVLNWSTATETNNQGFEIQRKSGSEFINIGFADGHGTTTEAKTYSFIDKEVGAGVHVYRLKQIDFNGDFEYSSEVEAQIMNPSVFALEQNYPNPFNPSTVINYSLATDAKVTLKVFDVLGQEVMTLLNSTISAGSHKIAFNASNLNSGVYFYTIDAKGIDGKNFTSTKKMILAK